jgi:hypothetical protein
MKNYLPAKFPASMSFDASKLKKGLDSPRALSQPVDRCGGRLHVAVFAHERWVDGSVK